MAKSPKVKRKQAPRRKRTTRVRPPFTRCEACSAGGDSVWHEGECPRGAPAGLPTEQAEADRRLPGGIRFDAYVVEPWYRRAWARVRRVFA